MVPFLGLLMLLRVLSTWSKSLLAATLLDGFDADDVAAQVPDDPEVWSDGSLVLDSVTGFLLLVLEVFAHQSELCWNSRRWCHVDRVQSDNVPHSCRCFVSVPGPLQTVQRAELWVVILALQSSDAVHVGVDNLGVDRHFGRLLE